jgi:hypothetical protein
VLAFNKVSTVRFWIAEWEVLLTAMRMSLAFPLRSALRVLR